MLRSLCLLHSLAVAAVVGLLVPATSTAQSHPAPSWVEVQPVVAEGADEIRLGLVEDTTARGDYSYNWWGATVTIDDPGTNSLDVYGGGLTMSGVTLDYEFANVDTGEIFTLTGFCFGASYAFSPYLKGFDPATNTLRGLRISLDGSNAQTMDISSSGPLGKTTNGCVDLGDQWAFGVRSSDLMRIYTSSDEGLNWNLAASYDPPAGDLTGPLDGGYGPAAGPVDTMMGRYLGLSYQLTDGTVQAAVLDPGNGFGLMDTPVSFDHPSHVDDLTDGAIKECDGYSLGLGAFGGTCNNGDSIVLKTLDGSDNSTQFKQMNTVPDATGFTESALEGLLRGDGLTYEIHTFANQHVRVSYELGGELGNPYQLQGYPGAGVGGPADAAHLQFGTDPATAPQRIYAGYNIPTPPRGGGETFVIGTYDPGGETVFADGLEDI